MRYSSIEQVRKSFLSCIRGVIDHLYYGDTYKPSEKELLCMIKDVCSCMNEKDYLFSDLSLKQLNTLVISGNIEAVDSKGCHIEEMEMLLREHYNPKMLSKAIDNAEVVILTYDNIAGNTISHGIEKQTIKQLLNL